MVTMFDQRFKDVKYLWTKVELSIMIHILWEHKIGRVMKEDASESFLFLSPFSLCVLFRCTGQMKLKILDMLFQPQLYPIS